MTGNVYQKAAMRTANAPDVPYGDLITGALGLAGESGEVADHVKKFIAQGHELSRAYVREELGDVLWYVAFTANAIGASLDDIMQENIDKLMQRYPGKGFDAERSRNREA